MAIYNPPVRLAPSILSADFYTLGKDIEDVLAAGADWIHFDVMDNAFVPNLTIGPLVCESIRPHVKAPIDVHLMVENVDQLVPMFAKAGADLITFHAEAVKHIDRTLGLIKSLDMNTGLVLNPATPLDILTYILDKIDVVLLMSVNPGFGGQTFIPSTLEKIAALRPIVEEHYTATGHEVLIEVDGGINPTNVKDVVAAGANVIVAGSAIFKKRTATGYRDVVTDFKKGIEKGVAAYEEAERERMRQYEGA